MEEAYLSYHRRPLMTHMIGVVALVMFIPFLRIFGALSQADTIHSYLMHLSVVLALIAFPGMISRINRRIVLLCTFAVVIYSLNCAMGPFASVKWFVNTLGFLFIFMLVSNYMKTISAQQLEVLEQHFSRLMLMLWIVCVCLYVVTLFSYWNDIVAFTTTMRFNNSILILTQSYGLQKQALGPFFGAMVLWHGVYWASLQWVRKVGFVCFMILSIPFFVGIRTLLLSFALLCLFLLWGSRKVAFVTKLAVFFLIPLIILLIIIWGEIDAKAFILHKNARLAPMLFSIDTLRQYPWGLGNGGYTVFVEPQVTELFHFYGGRAYGLNQFPLAPESDIVYFIASFGLLCPVFFLFYVYILSTASRILHSCSLRTFERFVLLFAMILIFGGISQDFAGKLAWWTYLGAATGLIFRYCRPICVTRWKPYTLREYDGRIAICPG